MTILDSFYILFGTKNAEQTRVQISAIDKQLDEMDKKGKKRTDADNKHYQELKKQRSELLDSLKQQQRELDKVGDSFERLTSNVIGAGLAYLSFGSLKKQTLEAQEFNRALAIQAETSGQNVAELKTLAAAYEQTGGTAEGFLSIVKSWTSIAAQANRPLHNVGEVISYIREQIKGLPKETQQFILQQRYGLPNEALRFFESTNEQYDKLIAKNKELGAITAEETKIADDFGNAWSAALQRVNLGFTHLGDVVLPPITRMLNQFAKGNADADLRGRVRKILGWNTATPEDVDAYIAAHPELTNTPSPSASTAVSSKQQIADFWRANGYDAGAVAGWLSQAQAESSFGANMGSGSHVGLYQWSTARRRSILENTNIDVANAPLDDQLKAALWEAHSMGLTPSALNGRGPAAASNILTQQYERPYLDNSLLSIESARRARMAQGYDLPTLSGASGGDKTISVKIDDINVNTQATDPAGIARGIGSALQNEFRNAVWNVNDGVSG